MDKPVRMLLGDYPLTQTLKKGELKSSAVNLEFADVKTVSTAFKRVVRNLEFDCSELAIVTFLMAKAFGKPLVLLPAVVMARFQHPHIVYNMERGPLSPADLAGRRVGTRSYTVTTSTWLREFLFGFRTSEDAMWGRAPPCGRSRPGCAASSPTTTAST